MSAPYNFLIYIFIYLSLFTFSNNKNEETLFPSILTLLNQHLVLVTNNGIHFYDSKLEKEEKDKFISLKISSTDDNYKTAMIQFSYEDGGYIIILVMNKIYFFNNNGTYISSANLSNLINGQYYSITPYKKQKNNLHYIISYKDDINKKLILNHFKFNIKFLLNKLENLKIFDIKINQINKPSDNIVGTTCLFVFSPLLNYTVLACVYEVSLPFEINIRTFDPKNNFNEIKDSYFYFIGNSSFFKNNISYISAINTNLDKKKLFIYFVYEHCPFWLIFDFEKEIFSPYKQYKNVELDGDYFHNKLFYFRENHEIVGLSKVKNKCQLYIFIFNLKYELKYKGIINQSVCNINSSFTLFFNGNKYVILNDINNKENNLAIKDIRHLDEGTNVSGDPKCKTSNEESSKMNLCTECNIEGRYKPVELKNNSLFNGFYECFNEITKPKNFYLNTTINKYKICYETCETCNGDGTYENNNCLTCDNNHIKKPGINGTKNCVVNCVYSYYYTPYGYYKCNNNSNCPSESSLYVKELNKCTNDCSKEEKYNKLYSGFCLENCPVNTRLENNVCKVENFNSCSKSENEIDLREFLTSGGVDVNAQNYANEFGYTEKHVSLFYNSQYSIILYQDSTCIKELSINIPKVDFGACYTKIITTLKKNVIIALVEKLNNKDKKSKISYFFYHPETGEKLDADTLCADDTIVVKEDVKGQLNESSVDFDQAKYLTDQSINIFDELDDFYTDICYHYEPKNGKILPVKERLRIYFPNITLCETGCLTKGVDLQTLESICECKFNNLFTNDIIEENALLKGTLGEISDIISNSNLDVLKCYKDVFDKEYALKNIGGYIIIIIFVIELIFAIKFLAYDMSTIRKYLYNLSEKYIKLIEDKKTNEIKHNQIKICVPPKKKEKNLKNKNYSSNNLKSGERTPKIALLLSKKKISTNSPNLLTNKISNDIYSIKNQDTENTNKPFDMDEYLKTDYDEMEYDDAVKNDKRSFWEFFVDRLKTKQMIADTFYHKDKIRPISIKLILFLLNIDLYFFINGLFFSEEYIIELYHVETEDSFFTYLPRSINRFLYATLVSLIVGIIIDCIFIEERKVKRTLIREKDDSLQLRYEIANICKSIKLRYNIFIFICFFIALISWYYICCFTNVYRLEEEWIKSSITIILIMQILSIIITLIETILRAISFQCKSEKIYKFRQILS